MSRVGKRPIPVPKGVEVTLGGQTIKAKGGKGEAEFALPDFLSAKLAEGQLTVHRKGETREERAMHGTARSLIANMIVGVDRGYSKQLEIQGVGYKAQLQGEKLVLNLGYSHSIEYTPPDGVTVTVKDGTKLEISGASKQLVGQVSAQLRAYAPAEPYKGKGVRYAGEQVRRKAGKTVA